MGTALGCSIDAVEAIYSGLETLAPHLWLERVVPAVAAYAGGGLGAIGHAYHATGPVSSWHISRPVVHDAPAELASVVEGWTLRLAEESFARSPPDFLERCYRDVGPAGTFSALTGIELTDLPSSGADAARLEVRDQIYVNAANPDGRGLLLVINLRARHRLVPGEHRRLAMLAAHGAAALRILLGLTRAAPAPVAIFDAGGKVAHLATEHETALPSLRDRVQQIDRARGEMRRADPERALSSWEALLSGRYSLVDRFESDQRRYVVAYVNEPGVVDPRGLTDAEAVVAGWAARGHSEKLIAYELGVAIGTVSGLLARAYRKLGVRSRGELVQLLRVPTDVEAAALPDGGDILVFSAPEVAMPEPVLGRLTDAERDVAQRVARGERNARIAAARGVSERTIAKQLTRIYAKLGVDSRAGLARLSSTQAQGPLGPTRAAPGARAPRRAP
ncbi:MAG: helix-turn-helix transcriptional regulator [Labilithrix sp.]|nr:helix-turn-helix transcriptional regulator [Labilithrix sp.]MCW5817375.1 helix-turn-helix transcriptional regulator [Labilithrix sp.]